jgi:hypothetical protein
MSAPLTADWDLVLRDPWSPFLLLPSAARSNLLATPLLIYVAAAPRI